MRATRRPGGRPVNVPGLADRLLAVAAMLATIRPLLRGGLGSRSHLSWKRAVVLACGGSAALVTVVGLLALHARLFGGPFFLPTWLGGTLAFFGGMLAVSALIAGRGETGLTEDAAIRCAIQAAAMVLYLAAPRAALVLIGGTLLLRALLPWTTERRRWPAVLQGAVLLALVAVPREPLLGGLRQPVASLALMRDGAPGASAPGAAAPEVAATGDAATLGDTAGAATPGAEDAAVNAPAGAPEPAPGAVSDAPPGG